MDVFTHALLGANSVYAANFERDRLRLRDRLLIGGCAAAFPDLDFAAFPVDPLRFLAEWHQGPTHSVLLLPAWAALIGAVYVAITGRRYLFRASLLASGIALASHVAADLITVYGTALLFPLSTARASLGTTFVIDPVFTAIVLAGLVAAVVTRRPALARIGLAMLVLYVCGQAYLQQRALDAGRTSASRHGIAVEQLSALPQPFSPFNWKLIVVDGDRYHESHVNLLGHRPLVPETLPFAELARAYRAPGELNWKSRYRFGHAPEQRTLAKQLWQDARLAPFRRFAVFPAISRMDSGNGVACVWFTDLRYDLPALPDTFRYGFCRDAPSESWELYRLRYFSEHSRQRLASD